MASTTSYVGRVQEVTNLLTWLDGLTIRLFSNNVTPDPSLTAAQFTESSFTGYVAIPLTSWGAAYLNGANQGEADHSAAIFQTTAASPGSNVYGYYITDGAGSFIFGERDPAAPVDMSTLGSVYPLSPSFQTNDT